MIGLKYIKTKLHWHAFGVKTGHALKKFIFIS